MRQRMRQRMRERERVRERERERETERERERETERETERERNDTFVINNTMDLGELKGRVVVSAIEMTELEPAQYIS